jgi:hypothetical protein
VNSVVRESSDYNRLIRGVFGLDKVLDDYLTYPESKRVQQQWQLVYLSLGDLLKEMAAENGGALSIAPLYESYEKLDPLIKQLAASQGHKPEASGHTEQRDPD